MTSNANPKPVLLVFGPLALNIDAAAVSKIREAVGSSGYSWLLDGLSNLPADYTTCVSRLPSLRTGQGSFDGTDVGLSQLRQLSYAIKTGQPLEESGDLSFPLPNKVLIPLVLVAQLTQYAEYLDRTCMGHNTDPRGACNRILQTLGCCTGLLGAFVASCSKNESQFRIYAGAAVRLGMLIGSVLDALEAKSEQKSGAISVSWNTDEIDGIATLQRILEDFPKTYISNHHDCNRVTVTGPVPSLLSLKECLKSNHGINSVDIKGLQGRYHSWHNFGVLGSLIQFCEEHPEFQLPDASSCRIPTRSNRNGGGVINEGGMHRHLLESILVDRMEWFGTFERVRNEFIRDTVIPDGQIVVFGFERPIPPSMAQSLGHRINYDYMAVTCPRSELQKVEEPGATQNAINNSLSTEPPPGYSKNDIAIVGMSIKVAGANDLESFWDVLCSGKSQHREVPKERFTFDENIFRNASADAPERRWFANLIDDPAEFDHAFFKKSPRESAAMDPQQRQMLQIAYQAVEMSRYFQPRAPHSSLSAATQEKRRVGCFIGCSTCDYEQNTACHPASAFSATGQLRSFIAGKVSHFFGWTGPSVTVDTACSSSAVAVHQACQSILSGDCTAALAGGSFVMAGPQWFEDLSAASFISPTGQCKPFDAAADGYCRGDGVAAVFLKRLGDAVADGDEVWGVIGATAVQQNENCTPIFVPNEPSLSDLFETALGKAGLRPGNISVVEAHGTGTAVGDPAEYGAIRRVLGGRNRGKATTARDALVEEQQAGPVYVGSAKGSVGHTECTAGVTSLIKVCLMLNKGMIPPQASFNSINMSMGPRPDDNIVINTGSANPWESAFKAAMVNSYGASGSNACIVVKQRPREAKQTDFEAFPAARLRSEGCHHPLWISANDDQGLRRYARALRRFISERDSNKHGGGRLTMMNLSMSLSRQRSRLLNQALMFKAHSLDDLERKLTHFETGASPDLISVARPSPKPVIFCFGGQVSTSVGLDRQVFEGCAVLQHHLNEVDAIARSHIEGGILPAVLDKSSPELDPVKLQLALFALQYASARAWMSCGIRPAALVGHSFGEITALCVGGALSVRDTVSLVVRRAGVVRDAWGADRGAMLAVEADLADAEGLVAATDGRAAIACYNGPRSFTFGGTTAAIVEIEREIALSMRHVRSKRLNVSNAFHCPLVGPLVQRLEDCARDIHFSKPTIHIERSTEFHNGTHPLGPRFVSSHMREPVYFHHAMKRLGKKYQESGAIFLEAGSNSTITNMASRALGVDMSSRFSFQAVDITVPPAATGEHDPTNVDRCWNSLADATLNLWAAGAVDLQHWAHHHSQPRLDGTPPLLLPPYQFEPARHWLDRVPVSEKFGGLNAGIPTRQTPQGRDHTVSASGMVSFAGLASPRETAAGPGNPEARGVGTDNVLFRVVTESPRYAKLVDGHKMARTAGVCPAHVQVDLAIEALCMTMPSHTTASSGRQGSSSAVQTLSASGLQPQISDVVCHVPLTHNSARMVWVEVPPVSRACALLDPARHHGSDDDDDSSFTTKDFMFELFSTDVVDQRDWGSLSGQSPLVGGNKTRHTTGTMRLVRCDGDNRAAAEFAQLSRLVSHAQATQLLLGDVAGADNLLSHRSVYMMFEGIVEYCNEYRGIQRLASRGEQTAAVVRRWPRGRLGHEEDEPYDRQPDEEGSWVQPFVADTFAQTAGMWINCLAAGLEAEQMFVFNGFERWLRAPPSEGQEPTAGAGRLCSSDAGRGRRPARQPAELHVLATHHRTSAKTAVSDVFVFDAATGKLVEVILGMGWVKVPRRHMQETLARLAGSGASREGHRLFGQDPAVPVAIQATADSTHLERPVRSTQALPSEQNIEESTTTVFTPATSVTTPPDVGARVKDLLAKLSGFGTSNVADNTELASLGIDSLMNMELASEIRLSFGVAVSQSELMRCTSVSGLVECVERLVGSSSTAKITRTNSTASETQTSSQVETADEERRSSSSSSRSSWQSVAASSRDGYSSPSENGTLSSSPASPPSPVPSSRVADKLEKPWLKGIAQSPSQLAARKAAVDGYVHALTQGWSAPVEASNIARTSSMAHRTGGRAVVAVTGGTGGLGAHIVARLATDPNVAHVLCLNRRSGTTSLDPLARQMKSVLSKTGLDLSLPRHTGLASKLHVLEADLSKPNLGMGDAEHDGIMGSVTHIVHCAWAMNLAAPGVEGFEEQLHIMRRLLDLARDAALTIPQKTVTFQLVSSIAVVGHHPLHANGPLVPEERVGIESVLPTGYADAKWACELMLDETLHRWPGLFRAMAVRLGQVAASRGSGYWNTAEHVSFMVRSSQTLGVLPDLGGTLGWTPADDVAGSLVDLLCVGDGGGGQVRPYPVYNIDNPSRTPWPEMIAVLARELGFDLHRAVVPFDEWVRRVRDYGPQAKNPAYLLIDFIQDNFERISCGGLLLETSRAREHSATMQNIEPFSHDLTRLFVQKWKESGFLDY